MPAFWGFLFGFLGEDQPIIVEKWGGTCLHPAVRCFETPIIYEEGINITQDLRKIWNEAFFSYMVNNEVGSFYYCVNPEIDDTGGLFLDDWVSFDTSKQELLRQIPSTNPLSILYKVYLGNGLSMCHEEVVGL